jgi:NaMN:DMB phosphoribosyltransferase
MTDIENKKWEDQLENKIISSEEIGKIESIANALKTPEGQEQTKKILDQVDDDFLDDIKKQALNILN